MIMVKVARVGSKNVEVALDDESSISAALAAAEITPAANEKISVNGEAAVLSDTLFDEDVVVLAKDAKSA